MKYLVSQFFHAATSQQFQLVLSHHQYNFSAKKCIDVKVLMLGIHVNVIVFRIMQPFYQLTPTILTHVLYCVSAKSRPSLAIFLSVAWVCLLFCCRSQRLQFDVSSPNGVLLFREISKLLVAYGKTLTVQIIIISS